MEKKEEGNKEKSIEIAEKLIKMGMKLKKIEEVTGITEEELEKMKSNIDK